MQGVPVKWCETSRESIPICEDILFTDGKKIFFGWLEIYLPLEEPLFYDSVNKEWPENITHWMPLPRLPKDYQKIDMEWINASENPPKLNKMLIFCKKCKNIHSVHYSYQEYCLAEACYESGHLFTGDSVEFDWYMPLPEKPEDKNGELSRYIR